MSNKKFVYLFSEGDASMRELLGGKGANLAEMTKIGLPVPQGARIAAAPAANAGFFALIAAPVKAALICVWIVVCAKIV